MLVAVTEYDRAGEIRRKWMDHAAAGSYIADILATRDEYTVQIGDLFRGYRELLPRYQSVAHEFHDGFMRGQAVAWIVQHECELWAWQTEERAERECWDMDEANIVAYIDLCYEGGSETFIQDHFDENGR